MTRLGSRSKKLVVVVVEVVLVVVLVVPGESSVVVLVVSTAEAFGSTTLPQLKSTAPSKPKAKINEINRKRIAQQNFQVLSSPRRLSRRQCQAWPLIL